MSRENPAVGFSRTLSAAEWAGVDARCGIPDERFASVPSACRGTHSPADEGR